MPSAFDLRSLLFSAHIDFLLRNNGLQVGIEALKGKKVGLYFSASWSGSCRRFTPNLVEVYNELISQKKDFEVVFVSADDDDESFDKYFSNMPWLAIPFSDSEKRDALEELFNVEEVPCLVIVDENGKVLTDNGVEIIRDHEAQGYPFTPERIQILKDQEEKARKEQTLRSILVSNSRDFVLSATGEKVPVKELEGKTVGLYFSLSSYRSCMKFDPVLIDVYEKLKVKGKKFEIVLISLDDDEELYKQGFASMPWYSLPFKDMSCVKLARYFDLSTLPTLVIIGPDGKTLCSNATETVEDHGVEAYPFTPERFRELAQIEKSRQENQTLESILVSGKLDFVIDKNGAKIPISHLVGKNILLYFSAHWCPPCRAFLPKLIEVYHQIKAKDDAFEVIFISGDKDQTTFEEFFTAMPWLAIPFGDHRKTYLCRLFKVFGIPKLVAVGPNGKTVTTEARELVMVHGGKAYPFTNERLKEVESELEEMTKGWPEKVGHPLHQQHELLLSRRNAYRCADCEGDGQMWSFNCEECGFDLHPKCALALENGINDLNLKDHETSNGGWICNDHVCVKIKELSDKIVGLYFSASWCPPCRGFTPSLIEVYKELSSKGDFEIVFVSSDRDEESFQEYFSKMPWLAIPISDTATKKTLGNKFDVMGIPHLVILGKDGKVSTDEGVELVMEHDVQAYPFTPERINQLKEEEEEAKQNQSLQSLLVSGSRDYLISSDEKKVPITELEGNMVGLYFCVASYGPCIEFTKKLVELQKELKKTGEKFELVLIYLDEDEEDGFKEVLAQLQCVALPFKDKKIEKLARYFELSSIPRLVIIGPDGKTFNPDVAELIDEHGAAAYPFSPEKLAELAEIEKAKLESQTLESILVSGEKDYVIDKSGSKVPVSQLVGKHVLIYFSAHWCPPCRAFTPKLIEAYHEIKAKESEFEIIFASSDRDQSSFDEYYSDMPWLALPFGDERKAELSRKFKVRGIPCLVAIGPEGKTVTTEARQLVAAHGANAFPFTNDHIKRVEGKVEAMDGYICEGDG
ncbi:putative nucleoredoxin 1 [Bienertia sinuspersici]